MIEQDWLTSTDPAAMLRCVTEGPDGVFSWPWGPASGRKLRLFACACCRSVWHLLTDERSRRAVEVAERWADGGESGINLDLAADNAQAAWAVENNAAGVARYCCMRDVVYATMQIVRPGLKDIDPQTQAALLHDIIGNPWKPVTLPKSRIRCDWCDATGEVMDGGSHGYNRTYEQCPSCKGEGWRVGECLWLTPTVVSLATAAYEERGQVCKDCKGAGKRRNPNPEGISKFVRDKCRSCHGTGRIEVGALDNARLAVLADALSDAGCEDETILTHLRSEGPHVRGCWAIDAILGKG